MNIPSRRRPKKSDRDKISANAKTLTRLLLWEASGGTIALPKGLENYKPPQIAFPERRALLDSISRLMLTDLKVEPEEEVSGFDLLRSGYGSKRSGGKNSDGGISSFDSQIPSRDEDDPGESTEDE